MKEFYKNRKVLITGHTGFKGAWMVQLLTDLGAQVYGYALPSPTNPALFNLLKLENKMESEKGDIRDLFHLMTFLKKVQPEIVIHMAAQPIVRTSYQDPVGTYETNVMGTVNVLECIKQTASVKSFVNVTTDKVYRNNEWERGYKEDDELCGYDPYSNSKSCSELVTDSYRNSFFMNLQELKELNSGSILSMEEYPEEQKGKRICAISTCRAGNVIGGGDFAKDRIIPDCFRAVKAGEEIVVRNPYSTRPYQHVLEPVAAYLKLAMMQYRNPELASAYNIGPGDKDCLTTGSIVNLFCLKWETLTGEPASWKNVSENGPHEANFLKLDCQKSRERWQWSPNWNIDKAMDMVVAWYACLLRGHDLREITRKQIEEYLA